MNRGVMQYETGAVQAARGMKRAWGVLFFLALSIYLPDLLSASSSLTWFEKGLSCLNSRRFEEAISAFSEAIEEDPRSAEAYINRGIAWYHKGEPDHAIADFKRALEIDPEFEKAYYNRAVAWEKKGEDDRALADYTRALEINPRHAEAYNSRGLILHRRGEYDGAISDYTRAIRAKPDFGEAYRNRGAAWHHKGNYDRALADYSKALELDPSDAGAYNNRGFILYRKGHYDRALADFSEALKVRPRYADAYAGRGMVWYGKGEYDRALSDYRKALELDPDYGEVYNRIAWLLAACPDSRYRDGVRAVAYARKAVALSPEVSFMDTLAAAYAEAGDFERALSVQKKAIALLTEQGDGGSLKEYEERLYAYEARRAWRQGRAKGSVSKGAEVQAVPGRNEARPYTIQVSSYRDRDKANRVAMRLREKGDPAFTCHTKIPGKGEWYRIFIGSYCTLQEARNAALELERRRFRHVIVSKLPYAVQVSLSESGETLEKLEKELWSKGYTAYCLPVPGKGGSQKRLLIGAFHTRKEALAQSEKLRRAGFVPKIVVR